MENMLRVGVITSTHGVRGEVKVFPTTDDAKRFKAEDSDPGHRKGTDYVRDRTGKILQKYGHPEI